MPVQKIGFNPCKNWDIYIELKLQDTILSLKSHTIILSCNILQAILFTNTYGCNRHDVFELHCAQYDSDVGTLVL